ncbi:hypothetical protein BP5796_12852 [Coleophoma crateriformis]|uniref:Retrotransposon gag domain-containing protein n=1 Tax=Coleophoma crateriformis TaxID=565419 RepID=A0A3D8Q4L7_9HELO|nr:hypothetical protein BP5796_12852 [Coleophoma crateriformis]
MPRNPASVSTRAGSSRVDRQASVEDENELLPESAAITGNTGENTGESGTSGTLVVPVRPAIRTEMDVAIERAVARAIHETVIPVIQGAITSMLAQAGFQPQTGIQLVPQAPVNLPEVREGSKESPPEEPGTIAIPPPARSSEESTSAPTLWPKGPDLRFRAEDIGLFWPDFNATGQNNRSDGVITDVTVFTDRLDEYSRLRDKNTALFGFPTCLRGIASDWYYTKLGQDTRHSFTSVRQLCTALFQRFREPPNMALKRLQGLSYRISDVQRRRNPEAWFQDVIRAAKGAGWTSKGQICLQAYNNMDLDIQYFLSCPNLWSTITDFQGEITNAKGILYARIPASSPITRPTGPGNPSKPPWNTQNYGNRPGNTVGKQNAGNGTGNGPGNGPRAFYVDSGNTDQTSGTGTATPQYYVLYDSDHAPLSWNDYHSGKELALDDLGNFSR